MRPTRASTARTVYRAAFALCQTSCRNGRASVSAGAGVCRTRTGSVLSPESNPGPTPRRWTALRWPSGPSRAPGRRRLRQPGARWWRRLVSLLRRRTGQRLDGEGQGAPGWRARAAPRTVRKEHSGTRLPEHELAQARGQLPVQRAVHGPGLEHAEYGNDPADAAVGVDADDIPRPHVPDKLRGHAAGPVVELAIRQSCTRLPTQKSPILPPAP